MLNIKRKDIMFKNKGILLSLLTMVISGFSIFANSVYVSKTDPLIFALIRNFLVATILTGILIFNKKLPQLRSLTNKDWGKLLLIGIIGGGLPFALFFTGLSQIGAVNGNIIQKSLFIWIALLAIPILNEKVKPVQWLGFAVLFVSMFFIGGTYKLTATTGTWLILAATLMWAVENIISKVALKNISPSVVSWGRMTFGLPVLFMATFITGNSSLLISPTSYAFAPLLISTGFLAAYVLTWYSALRTAPATLVSSVLVGAPVITAILAAIFQGKIPVLSQIWSFSGLLLGVILVAFGTIKPRHAELVSASTKKDSETSSE